MLSSLTKFVTERADDDHKKTLNLLNFEYFLTLSCQSFQDFGKSIACNELQDIISNNHF